MMKPVLFPSSAQRFHRSIIRMLALSLLSVSALAQQPAVRISRDIVNSDRVVISGSHSPRATLSGDSGAVSAETRLQGITLVFNRSEAQQSALQALIKAQQDRSSSSYHKWLTPDEFAARFGMTDKDIARVETWLEQQGFSIDSVSRSKDRIRFTGTAGQAETAFGTELHYYKSAGKTSFQPIWKPLPSTGRCVCHL